MSEHETYRTRSALGWAVEEAHARAKPLHLLHALDPELSLWCRTDGRAAGTAMPALGGAWPSLAGLRDQDGYADLLRVVGSDTSAVTRYDLVAPYLGGRRVSPAVLVPRGRTAASVLVVVDPTTSDGTEVLAYAVEQASLRGLGLRVALTGADRAGGRDSVGHLRARHPGLGSLDVLDVLGGALDLDEVVGDAIAQHQIVVAAASAAHHLLDLLERTLGCCLAAVLVILPMRPLAIRHPTLPRGGTTRWSGPDPEVRRSSPAPEGRLPSRADRWRGALARVA